MTTYADKFNPFRKADKMDDTVDTADLVYRLHKRAEIRRNIPHRKSVIEGKPDRLAELLDEAGKEISSLRKELKAKND